MPLTFDDVDRGSWNMCRELSAPLFGEHSIRVAEDDMRWLVPRGERIERGGLASRIACLRLLERQRPRPPIRTGGGIRTVERRPDRRSTILAVKSTDCDRTFQSRSASVYAYPSWCSHVSGLSSWAAAGASISAHRSGNTNWAADGTPVTRLMFTLSCTAAL